MAAPNQPQELAALRAAAQRPTRWTYEMTSDLQLAQSSGFPLQMAIESAVSKGTASHGWQVSSHEHPWSYGPNTGFADLILERGYGEIVRVVIECKKRKGDLLFFCNADNLKETSRFRVRWGYRLQQKSEEGGWVDVNVSPASLESEFCAVIGEGADKRRTLLESTAFEVTQAAEGICTEELALTETDLMGSALVYLPMIVTTARLLVCKMDPGDVDLSNGELRNANFESVPFIRFRKTLTTDGGLPTSCRTLAEAQKQAARTVVVVAAEHLDSFLGEWKIGKRTERDLPWVTLRKRIDDEDRAAWMRKELGGRE